MQKSSIITLPMYITKSSISDGMMRWSAVNSDTDWDLHDEKMSLGLYQKMLGYIQTKSGPPKDFKDIVCSEYWCGGMPYLSIAHYNDANGKAVPGQPTKLFIDGTQLKAKGVLFDTPLGQAVWKSLKKDESLGENEDRIRISIAFLDLSHKHGDGGRTFIRNSMESVCPECLANKGNKIYLDGYLVHLALTRVPVNPRTIITAEDIMAKKSNIQTRKEDAESILGDKELADEVERSALETKSDILVEMSEPEVVVEDAKTKRADDGPEGAASEEEEMMADGVKKKKKEMMKALTAENVTSMVKSIVAELVPAPVVAKKSGTVSKSALDIATNELYTSVESAIGLQGVTLEQRLESINPALGNLGNAITAVVRESTGVAAPVTTPADGLVLESVTSLTNIVADLAQKVAMLQEKSLVVPQNNVVNRMPVQRSIQPQMVLQSQLPVNPNSITNVVRRTVSSDLPLK